ncbi:membrane hypothetical protein [uncultured Gammaproteobacteria bacterium]
MAKVLNTTFFARRDTAGPVRVAIIATGGNAVLAVALMPVLGHVGIALASAASAWLTVGLLARNLARSGHLDLDEQFRTRLPRILLAAAGMGAALVAGQAVLAPWLTAVPAIRTPALAGALAGLILGGMAVYFTLVQVTGAARLEQVRGLLRPQTPSEGASP